MAQLLHNSLAAEFTDFFLGRVNLRLMFCRETSCIFAGGLLFSRRGQENRSYVSIYLEKIDCFLYPVLKPGDEYLRHIVLQPVRCAKGVSHEKQT